MPRLSRVSRGLSRGRHSVLRRNHRPVEALRWQWFREVDQHQRATDAGDGAAGIDPVGEAHGIAILQLIRLTGHGWDRERHNRAIENIEELNFRNLIRRRAEGNGKLKDRAVVVRPAENGRPVETAIATLHQPGLAVASTVGDVAKGVKIRFAAAGADPKHGPTIAPSSTRSSHRNCRRCPVPARLGVADPSVPVAAKGVQTRVAAAGTDPKHGAAVAARVSRRRGRPVEIAIASLHQPGMDGPIVGGAAKGVKIRVAAAGTDPKHGAGVAVRPAVLGRPVEIAVTALHQPGLWIAPIVGGAAKGVKTRVGAAGTDPKHGAAACARPAGTVVP